MHFHYTPFSNTASCDWWYQPLHPRLATVANLGLLNEDIQICQQVVNFFVENGHLGRAEGVGAAGVGRVNESIAASSKYLASNGLNVNGEAGMRGKKKKNKGKKQIKRWPGWLWSSQLLAGWPADH